MSDITAIMTAYRRPALLQSQVEALRRQSLPPMAVWLWANEPHDEMLAEISGLSFDRTVICSENAYMHARFSLALTAPTKYVAVFDDDSIPGEHWFANCYQTMQESPGILGSAGVRLADRSYRSRTLYGWHVPTRDIVEVDLVGHAWFLPTAWVQYLFYAAPVVGNNGEDIELCARAWRLAGIKTFCPPHPPDAMSQWGSTRGTEFGSDQVAVSRRPTHLQERDQVVCAEMDAGWQPLFQRLSQRPPKTQQLRASPSVPSKNVLSQPATKTETPSHTWLQMVPPTAKRFLEIGCSAPPLVAALRNGQSQEHFGIAWSGEAATQVKSSFDAVHVADPDRPDLSLAEGPFDCVICPRPECVRNPDQLLRQVHSVLQPDGNLIARFPNLRHHSLVGALLDGTWSHQNVDLLPSDQVRFFTRREIEKLCYRTGFEIVSMQPVPGSGYDQWQRQGRPRQAQLGPVAISGMRQTEVDEFYLSHYWLQAKPQPPCDFGLTSIVIVTHNQLAFTHMCLDSIRMRTDETYELIIVDNQSSDGTVQYLQSLRNVKVICNDNNRGFPAAANQGMQVANGRQILLLNNDCVVSTGWLKRLLQALYRNSDIGLVGPCSNRVSGEQQIAVTYEDIAEMDGFAWDWGSRHAGQFQDTDRLVGFCLLFRKDVVDRIGMLDERFGVGCFEDDDFCMRARAAGQRAVIARDAFVHHFGGRTFIGAGVDFAGLMKENQRKFEQKWSAQQQHGKPNREATAVADTQSTPDRQFSLRVIPDQGLQLVAAKPLLSLCMIVRDNEKTIRPALDSIRPWVDEMIVVDTGSQDRTPEIAQSLGARVFHFPWVDSFSEARNESIKHAWGEWIFWMDSDDTIDEANGRKLRELVSAQAPPATLGYVVQVHCPGSKDNPDEVTVVDHVKLFRNLPELRFEQRIHEQILPSIKRKGGEVKFTDIFVVHSGYDTSEEGQRRKIQRDLHLLVLFKNSVQSKCCVGIMLEADFGQTIVLPKGSS